MKGHDMPHLTSLPPVTLHLGAHRTGATSLQHLLTRNLGWLASRGIAYWGPRRTRDGVMSGVIGDPGRVETGRDIRAHRAAGRIAMLRSEMQAEGTARLLISDQALLGSLRENLLLGRLYPTARARLARLAAAMPGIDHVALAIRSPDAWWTSVFADLMTRGFAPPDRATIEAVLGARRGWRDVIEDVAEALPGARLTVWMHEDRAAHPERALMELTDLLPEHRGAPRLRRAPTCAALQDRLRQEGCMTQLPEVGGLYAPFTPDERAHLRSRYDADLAWLRAGADGLIAPEDNDIRPPSEGPFRDRRPRHGQDRRQDPMGAAG
ncbi:hypothetical protein [Jannaschia marina]|uniref:hypothetical protein n=1 Tax=Jannaschia marina TaxID=2741674 RepID=UPI0015C734B0|nr:hypothetical protein [Jannaschia marina]